MSTSNGAIPLNWDKGSSCRFCLFVCSFFFLIYETPVSALTAHLLACSAGVFFERANVFARESEMLKLQKKRRKWVAISTFPNLPLSSNQRWRLKQYEHKQAAFARPKYACDLPLSRHALYQPTNHWLVVKRQVKRHENANLGSCLYEVVTKRP